MTIHDFDMARFLFGEEVSSVVASAAALVDPDIRSIGDFDTVNVILTTASGKQCTISNSRRSTYGYDQRLEVHGSAGMATAANQRPLEYEIATANGFGRPVLHDFFMTRYAASYRACMFAFIDVIAERSCAELGGEDGLMALGIAVAAMKSVQEQRTIRLEEVL